MDRQISIPILLALIGFLIADYEGLIGESLFKTVLRIDDRTSVRSRLAQLGRTSDEDYENFRLAQMAAAISITVLFTLLLFLDFISFGSYLLLSMICSICVIVYLEKNLSDRCRRRAINIESEFPSLIEMLTLAVGAGESPVAAISRIASRSSGHLPQEFRRVVSDIESGTSFAFALDLMSKRVNSVSVRRFVDSLIISISRGTPLVETLTHNVNESRNQERVRLLTAAGKSEISMMIPVVFLILPISILFALFPSLNNLNLFGS